MIAAPTDNNVPAPAKPAAAPSASVTAAPATAAQLALVARLTKVMAQVHAAGVLDPKKADMEIGTQISLRAADGSTHAANEFSLTGAGLTLVDVVALAGDYFADVNDPISDHNTLTATHEAQVVELASLPAHTVKQIHDLAAKRKANLITDLEMERQLAQLVLGT